MSVAQGLGVYVVFFLAILAFAHAFRAEPPVKRGQRIQAREHCHPCELKLDRDLEAEVREYEAAGTDRYDHPCPRGCVHDCPHRPSPEDDHDAR